MSNFTLSQLRSTVTGSMYEARFKTRFGTVMAVTEDTCRAVAMELDFYAMALGWLSNAALVEFYKVHYASFNAYMSVSTSDYVDGKWPDVCTDEHKAKASEAYRIHKEQSAVAFARLYNSDLPHPERVQRLGDR